MLVGHIFQTIIERYFFFHFSVLCHKVKFLGPETNYVDHMTPVITLQNLGPRLSHHWPVLSLHLPRNPQADQVRFSTIEISSSRYRYFIFIFGRKGAQNWNRHARISRIMHDVWTFRMWVTGFWFSLYLTGISARHRLIRTRTVCARVEIRVRDSSSETHAVYLQYTIPYWREKVAAVAHLNTKFWRNLVVLTMTF
jgi:hypothetical protein